MNTKVSTLGDQSSSWGPPILPSNVMPSNQNEGVTTSESCLIVVTIIPKSGIVGDKLSCLGAPFFQAMSWLQNQLRVLLQMNHAPMWLLTRNEQDRQYKQRVCNDETIQIKWMCWAARKQQQ